MEALVAGSFEAAGETAAAAVGAGVVASEARVDGASLGDGRRAQAPAAFSAPGSGRAAELAPVASRVRASAAAIRDEEGTARAIGATVPSVASVLHLFAAPVRGETGG